MCPHLLLLQHVHYMINMCNSLISGHSRLHNKATHTSLTTKRQINTHFSHNKASLTLMAYRATCILTWSLVHTSALARVLLRPKMPAFIPAMRPLLTYIHTMCTERGKSLLYMNKHDVIIHTYVHTYNHTYIPPHVRMYVCNVCMYVLYVCMHVCMYVRTYIHMYVHIGTYVHTYVTCTCDMLCMHVTCRVCM